VACTEHKLATIVYNSAVTNYIRTSDEVEYLAHLPATQQHITIQYKLQMFPHILCTELPTQLKRSTPESEGVIVAKKYRVKELLVLFLYWDHLFARIHVHTSIVTVTPQCLPRHYKGVTSQGCVPRNVR